jgi:hypothetical protein
VWEWVRGAQGFDAPTMIQAGQTATFTFVAFPIGRDQWVKAIEFEWEGTVYRQEFGLGPWGNSYGYRDCGDLRPHVERPTPTPRP